MTLATYMRKTRDQQRFTISTLEVEADLPHESLLCSGADNWTRGVTSRYTTTPVSYTTSATSSTLFAVDLARVEPATSPLRYYIIRKQYHDSLLLDHCTKHDTLAPL